MRASKECSPMKDDEDHTLCLEELPKLPKWKPRRRGKKRGRSKSSGRASKRRMAEIQKQDHDENEDLQVQVYQEDHVSAPDPVEYEETRSIRLVDQPRIRSEGIDDEVMVIEDQAEVDHDLEGIKILNLRVGRRYRRRRRRGRGRGKDLQ